MARNGWTVGWSPCSHAHRQPGVGAAGRRDALVDERRRIARRRRVCEGYNKQGGTWVDNASVGPQAEHAAALNRIAGGNPPTAMQWNIGVAVRQLAEQGILTPLDDLAKKGNWLANLPPLLVKNMSYEGHVIAVPVNIHGANYQFYSVKVFDELKMQPPKTWDEFLAMAPKIKAAGYIPLAYGANAQQVDWLFEALLVGIGGKDLYRKVWVDQTPRPPQVMPSRMCSMSWASCGSTWMPAAPTASGTIVSRWSRRTRRRS